MKVCCLSSRTATALENYLNGLGIEDNDEDESVLDGILAAL